MVGCIVDLSKKENKYQMVSCCVDQATLMEEEKIMSKKGERFVVMMRNRSG